MRRKSRFRGSEAVCQIASLLARADWRRAWRVNAVGEEPENPARMKPREDVRNGPVNSVIVCTLDRLTPLLLNFARILAVPGRHSASFVSLTRQF